MKPRLPFFNYAIRNQTSDTLEIAIDGSIVDAETEAIFREWWGDDSSVSFKSFRNSVNTAVAGGVKTINGTINSPGGQVTEAMAIHDFIVGLQNKGVNVNMTGCGIVASAATYILMASRNSSMTANSWFMIHNVSGCAYGDVNDIETQAKQLRKFNDAVRDFYASATGQPKETIADWMNKETWLTATEARDEGFVKKTTSEVAFTNTIKPEQWLFSNTTVLNAYNSSISNPLDMNLDKITTAIEAGFQNMLTKLGIKNEEKGAQEALSEFSKGITDAIKEVVPDESKIQEMVNNALGALKELPKNVNDAITAAAENALKENEAVKNVASKEDIKNLVSKDDLKKVEDELEETKKSVANRTGGTGAARNAKNEGEPVTAANHSGITWGDQGDDDDE